jgi:hypothetical protein
MAGYEFDGSACVYKTTSYSYTSGYSASLNNCPINSHASPSDSTKCQCDVGFQPNLAKDGCTTIPVKTNDQVCQDSFGLNSNWAGTKTNDGQLNCDCQIGYQFNDTKTACVFIAVNKDTSPSQYLDVKTFYSSLQKGSYGSEVKLLQGLLKESGIYNSDITGYYGPKTQKAVVSFQLLHNITPTGTVGPKTRSALNDFLKARN